MEEDAAREFQYYRARDNYSNNPRYRTNRAYALVGFNIEDFVRLARKISVWMSEEKQDKESKKVAERVISIKRGDVFKNEVATDNIW